MINPAWSLIGTGTLRRGEEDAYVGRIDIAGFPYHLHARVECDERGKFFAVRAYYEPRKSAPGDAPVQEGLAL